MSKAERGAGALASQVVLIARDSELLAPALAWHRARRLDSPSVQPWTDAYSDFISAVWRRYKTKLQTSLKQE